LSAELTKTHSYRLFFFSDFAHWDCSSRKLNQCRFHACKTI